MMLMDDFGIWFGYDGAHASFEVPFELGGEIDYDVADVVIDLYVSAWEHSIYRPTERTFEIQDIALTEFGRVYHFELEELIPNAAERERFMEALEAARDEYIEDCRADAAADY